MSSFVFITGKAEVSGKHFTGTEGPYKTPEVTEKLNTSGESVFSRFSFSIIVSVRSEIFLYATIFTFFNFQFAGILVLLVKNTEIVFLLFMCTTPKSYSSVPINPS